MNEWETIFRAVRSTARKSQPLDESVRQLVEFAHDNPVLCDDPDYWTNVQAHNFRPAYETMVGWAHDGVAQLKPKEGWEFLLLDLGDCPETFRLYSPGGQELMSESKLQGLLTQELIVEVGAFDDCFTADVSDTFDLLFGDNCEDLANYHLSQLDDDLLNGTGDIPERDFHGNNGYLLWLILGSLALLSPFNEEEHCERVLQGRDKLYLLSGYEEIFSPLATVTATGLVYHEG